MGIHIPSVVAAFFTLAALYLAGVLLLLDPVAAGDAASGHLLPLPLAFVVAVMVYIALFVWLEWMIGEPFKAAMAIVLSQMALVNVDFVLSGKRGVATAAASTLILFVSWSAVAWVYGRLKPKSGLPQPETPSSTA
jgi:uncharacterized membrane protein YesL